MSEFRTNEEREGDRLRALHNRTFDALHEVVKILDKNGRRKLARLLRLTRELVLAHKDECHVRGKYPSGVPEHEKAGWQP